MPEVKFTGEIVKNKDRRDSVKKPCRRVKVMPLLTVLFISIFVFSVQFASFYHHSLIVHRDCPICKFFAVFTAGGETAVHQMIIPEFARIIFTLENLICFSAILTFVLGTRAPPYSFPRVITASLL
jgi:hypothetical protein